MTHRCPSRRIEIKLAGGQAESALAPERRLWCGLPSFPRPALSPFEAIAIDRHPPKRTPQPCRLTSSRPRRTFGHGLGRSVCLHHDRRQPSLWRRPTRKKACFGRKRRTLRLSRAGRCRRRRLGLPGLADFQRKTLSDRIHMSQSADRHTVRDRAFPAHARGRALVNGAATRLRPSGFDR